jgi:pimeloyl-ACP methyl ester carboxylesterase
VTPRDYALLAQEAYTAAPDIGKADSASRAIVRDTAAGLAVAFPGSDNLDCWLTDFDIKRLVVPGIGIVHQGFYQAWQAISVEVLAAIDGKPVTLVGHSLGAAISLMAAADMMQSGIRPAAVYGFEAPRVSPTSCVADILKPVNPWLCRNGSDPVPDVPPRWKPGGVVLQIGKRPGIIPDVRDHFLVDSVIPALAAMEAVAA